MSSLIEFDPSSLFVPGMATSESESVSHRFPEPVETVALLLAGFESVEGLRQWSPLLETLRFPEEQV